jgi:U2 small nuclear ribonucleoprotein B''
LYAKTKSDTVAKLDGSFKMPEPDLPERETEESVAQPTGFAAKGQKRKVEEEEEEEDDDAEMEMDSDSD